MEKLCRKLLGPKVRYRKELNKNESDSEEGSNGSELNKLASWVQYLVRPAKIWQYSFLTVKTVYSAEPKDPPHFGSLNGSAKKMVGALISVRSDGDKM